MRLFRAFLLGGAMMAAALTGCMMPDQVDELMYANNHQKIVVVISDETENGDDREGADVPRIDETERGLNLNLRSLDSPR